ncbi:Hypothetical_protein [Hexamita inflata]|uniref:Hypothetical_protein n=1 Tax=Hexamita inflata TaxID=28002 RepID=A0ABP1HP79_9EUKA
MNFKFQSIKTNSFTLYIGRTPVNGFNRKRIRNKLSSVQRSFFFQFSFLSDQIEALQIRSFCIPVFMIQLQCSVYKIQLKNSVPAFHRIMIRIQNQFVLFTQHQRSQILLLNSIAQGEKQPWEPGSQMSTIIRISLSISLTRVSLMQDSSTRHVSGATVFLFSCFKQQFITVTLQQQHCYSNIVIQYK